MRLNKHIVAACLAGFIFIAGETAAVANPRADGVVATQSKSSNPCSRPQYKVHLTGFRGSDTGTQRGVISGDKKYISFTVSVRRGPGGVTVTYIWGRKSSHVVICQTKARETGTTWSDTNPRGGESRQFYADSSAGPISASVTAARAGGRDGASCQKPYVRWYDLYNGATFGDAGAIHLRRTTPPRGSHIGWEWKPQSKRIHICKSVVQLNGSKWTNSRSSGARRDGTYDKYGHKHYYMYVTAARR